MKSSEKQRYFREKIGEKMKKEGFTRFDNIYIKIIPSQMIISVFLQTYGHGQDVCYSFVPLAIEKANIKNRVKTEAESVQTVIQRVLGNETYSFEPSEEIKILDLNLEFLCSILEKPIFLSTNVSDFLEYYYEYYCKLGINRTSYALAESIAGAYLLNQDYCKAREPLISMIEALDSSLVHGRQQLKKIPLNRREEDRYKEFMIRLNEQQERFLNLRNRHKKLIEMIDSHDYKK